MTNKNLVILAAAAAVLGGAAYFCNSGRKIKSSNLNGKPVLPAFDVSEVAKVEVGGSRKLTLAATDSGWVVDSLYGYPADVTKIRENILKLQDLKVGQMATGTKIEKPVAVELKNSAGKAIASLQLGGTHIAKPKGQMAQFGGGGYPDGRYVKFRDEVVLVKDALDAFDGDFKKWVDTRICAVSASDVTDVVYASGGEKVELNDVPMIRKEVKQEDGTTEMLYGLSFTWKDNSASSVVKHIWPTAMSYVDSVVVSLKMLFTGQAGFTDMSGPVGIVNMMSDTAAAAPSVKAALISMLDFGGLIAINLAVMNLLPLPALDGGRVAGLLIVGVIQKITKKKLDPKYEGYVHAIGMILLLVLMAVIMFKDILFIFKR